jgi:hypothetical protein
LEPDVATAPPVLDSPIHRLYNSRGYAAKQKCRWSRI